jgi:hypothetical protein
MAQDKGKKITINLHPGSEEECLKEYIATLGSERSIALKAIKAFYLTHALLEAEQKNGRETERIAIEQVLLLFDRVSLIRECLVENEVNTSTIDAVITAQALSLSGLKSVPKNLDSDEDEDDDDEIIGTGPTFEELLIDFES